MKIWAQLLTTGETFIFNSLAEAVKKTGVSGKRIKACIKWGWKWRLWIFDEV